MARLRKFLEENREEIVNHVEGSSETLILTKVREKLVATFQMEKLGVTPVTDAAHVKLMAAILTAMWCGWLSQAKANRNVYDKDWPNQFREAIIDAFEVGQEYAKDRP